jgi:hypothetical protein
MSDSSVKEMIQMATLSTSDVSLSAIDNELSHSVLSQVSMFMIRVSGSTVYFYSHKFSNSLLKSITCGTEPLTHTQVQKFMVTVDNLILDGLSLLIGEHHSIILPMLDSIQQIISSHNDQRLDFSRCFFNFFRLSLYE